jgi:bile acid:Na+ symporter, BASS family
VPESIGQMVALLGVLTDIRYWVIAAVLVAFAVGSIGPVTSTLVIVVLMLQMTAAMDGLAFNKSEIVKDKKAILLSVVSCFGISTGVTLAVGFLFISSYPDVWMGWVMLAAVPSAVSVITVALFMRGDMVMSVLSTVIIYLCALVLTPLITMVFVGDAVDPLEIFKYILLFVAVPLVVTVPLRRLHLKRAPKVIFINMMMFSLVALSVGYNRGVILGDPVLVTYVILACFIRLFLVSFIVIYAMKKSGVDRDDGVIYMAFSVWKNSGLATTMCLVLLTDASEAVVPCVVSVLVETVWFAVMTGYLKKTWPPEESIQERVVGV